MEPWVTVAEKLGYKIVAEAFYVGSEIASEALDAETFAAINRAVSRAAAVLTEDVRPWLHYLIADVSKDIVALTPGGLPRRPLPLRGAGARMASWNSSARTTGWSAGA